MSQRGALLGTFVTESEDLLVQLEEGLLTLEERPDDAKVLNGIFRVGHTFKGSAGLLELRELVDFTHVFENVLDRLRKSELHTTKAIVTLLLSARDVLQGMVDVVAAGDEPGETETSRRVLGELRSLSSVRAEAAPAATVAARAEAAGEPQMRVYRIDFKLTPDTLARGQDPVMLLFELEDLGELLRVEARAEALPAFEALDPEQIHLAWTVLLHTAAPPAKVEGIFVFVRDEGTVRIKQVMSCEHFA